MGESRLGGLLLRCWSAGGRDGLGRFREKGWGLQDVCSQDMVGAGGEDRGAVRGPEVLSSVDVSVGRGGREGMPLGTLEVWMRLLPFAPTTVGWWWSREGGMISV